MGKGDFHTKQIQGELLRTKGATSNFSGEFCSKLQSHIFCDRNIDFHNRIRLG